MFLDELKEFLLLSLGELYGFADEGWQCPGFEFYCVVPGLQGGEFSFFPLFEDISVVVVLLGDIV